MACAQCRTHARPVALVVLEHVGQLLEEVLNGLSALGQGNQQVMRNGEEGFV